MAKAKQWLRRGTVVLMAASCMIGGIGSVAGASKHHSSHSTKHTTTTIKTGGKVSPSSAYAHPCTLLSNSQASSVMSETLTSKAGYTRGTCMYVTSAQSTEVTVMVQSQPGLANGGYDPNQTTKEPSVGKGAFCVNTLGQAFVNVKKYSFSVGADTCAHAAALLKDVASRIS